jgi:heterodisulfide reductase subunit A
VGGGAAGVAAALALARRGRKVLLVERAHALGGVAATLDEVFPGMECASCFLQPALDQVLHHPAIEVLTGAEVLDVRGSHGNLTVRVRVRPRRVDPERCLGCDACAAACPVELPTGDGLGLRRAVGLPLPGGLPAVSAVDDACLHVRGDGCTACAQACASGAIRLDEQPLERSFRCGAVVLAVGAEPPPPPSVAGVVSAYQLERMMHPGGPTRGEIRRADGRMPRSILLAPAASASDDLWPHELAKLGLRIRHRHPEASVAVAGALEASPHLASLAGRLAASGATVIPGTVDATAAELCGDGVRVRLSTGASFEADLVAVWEPPRPAEGVAELARRLRIAVRPDGFLEDHVSPFEPATSRIAGIHVAGAAGGPRTILQAARDGTAAAGQVLSALEPGAPLELEPLAAEVDVERCAACGICGTVCPFGAVGVSAELGVSRVEPSFCRGCGSCVASCPSGALAAPHFTSCQIAAEVSGLLRAGAPPEERKSGP